MPLRAPILALLCLALAAPATSSAAVPRSAAKAVLAGCERGADELDRAAVFEGQMRTLPGASRLRMRFTLQVREPGTARWNAVAAPGFGTWVGSAPGVSRYIYTKRVENLIAPASYRVLLRFRWLRPDGRVLARAKAYSRACRQPDPRPNLVVSSLGVQPGPRPGRNRYVAFVRNPGRSAAPSSSLRISLDGVGLPLAHVAALEPGEGVVVTVEGPACTAATPVDAAADAAEAVDESDEADNRFTRLCPPPS
jgi:hypothetical protein